MKISVCIDIGTQTTKVVEIEHKLKPQLLNAFTFPTPLLISHQGSIAKQIDSEVFFKEISQHIPFAKLKACKLGVSIPLHLITIMPLLLPRMGKNEVITAAVAEAKRKMIPATSPHHIFESFVLGERMVGKVPKLEVTAVRTEKNYIQEIVGLFKGMGVIPSAITPACCSVANLLPKDVGRKNDDVALVDLGYHSINITILRERKLYFMRNVAYGFKEVVDEMSRQLSLSVQEVEQAIREKGIPEASFDLSNKVAVAEEIMRQKYEAGMGNGAGETQKQEVNLLELRVLWQSHLDRIQQEIRRSLAFYKEQAQESRVEHIYFFGGASQIKNLVPLLSKQIGGKTEVLLPFKDIHIAKEGLFGDPLVTTPILANAAAIALAISEKQTNETFVNFLPVELRQREATAARRLMLFVGGITFGCALLLASLNQWVVSRNLRLSIQKAVFQLSTNKDVSEKIKALNQQQSLIDTRIGYIDEVVKQRKLFSDELKGVLKSVPQEIVLTRLGLSKNATRDQDIANAPAGTPLPPMYQISIEGMIFAEYEKASALISQFSQSLASQGRFSNIEVSPLQLEMISYQSAGSKEADLHLTQPRLRKFSLSVGLNEQ